MATNSNRNPKVSGEYDPNVGFFDGGYVCICLWLSMSSVGRHFKALNLSSPWGPWTSRQSSSFQINLERKDRREINMSMT